MKKHVTQMTDKEKEVLTELVDKTDISTIEITQYTVYRFEQRFDGITLLDIAKTFLDYELIEFNTNSGDRRVLIRGNENLTTDRGCYNVCIVYSLRNNRIITAWLNNFHDNHDTLRLEEYTQELEISL